MRLLAHPIRTVFSAGMSGLLLMSCAPKDPSVQTSDGDGTEADGGADSGDAGTDDTGEELRAALFRHQP